jgi:uncharacterized protein YutE (UPF0331/DUF86 family)
MKLEVKTIEEADKFIKDCENVICEMLARKGISKQQIYAHECAISICDIVVRDTNQQLESLQEQKTKLKQNENLKTDQGD